MGDNFYWTGNSGDWSTQWGNVYGTADPSSPLYNIPWLAVLGNHDIGDTDKYTACPGSSPTGATVGGQKYGSLQMNKDKNPLRPSWTEKFYLPDYSYHYEIADVGVELIAVDENANDIGGLGGDSSGHRQMFATCGGQGSVAGFLGMIKQSGEDLLVDRAKKGKATTVLIINHYPGIGSDLKNKFQGAAGGRKVNVLSAYGHTHQQQCDGRNSAGQCDLIMTGGGGGCCSSDLRGNYAGFTAVHLTEDGSFTSDVESSAVRNERGACSW